MKNLATEGQKKTQTNKQTKTNKQNKTKNKQTNKQTNKNKNKKQKQKKTCPLRRNCPVNDIVYKAKVTSIDSQKPACYIGLASGNFKARFNNHNKSFRNERYEKDTELSKFNWNFHSIDWEILKKSNTYKRAIKHI